MSATPPSSWALTNRDGLGSESRFFDGHFPGTPIVPGAVLMGLLAQTCKEHGYGLERIARIKFLQPLEPDMPFEMQLVPQGKTWTAVIKSDARVIAMASCVLSVGHG